MALHDLCDFCPSREKLVLHMESDDYELDMCYPCQLFEEDVRRSMEIFEFLERDEDEESPCQACLLRDLVMANKDHNQEYLSIRKCKWCTEFVDNVQKYLSSVGKYSK